MVSLAAPSCAQEDAHGHTHHRSDTELVNVDRRVIRDGSVIGKVGAATDFVSEFGFHSRDKHLLSVVAS